MPRHIAIIMDGSGRWAVERGLTRAEGYRHGVENIPRVVQAAIELGIPYLTLLSFSLENWARPRQEINKPIAPLKRVLCRDLAKLHEHGVRIRVIGERGGVEGEVIKAIEETVALTSGNDGLQLTMAFNYDSRREIARAARCIVERVRDGALAPEDITADLLGTVLDTASLPDPDLLIGTGGKQSLNNFLLWQFAYTEFVFVDTCWPDFTRETLRDAIAEYQNRNRRYGGLAAKSST
ncbi:MAG: di-trans,poly-cis-decaprenylcistransferase [Proteobacteria bacterium]|nr:di-trans,poly-cis-decaprenylcistransferase [Pseudomonadota bacterium]